MIGEVNVSVVNLLHTNLRKSIQPRAYYHLDLELLKNGDSPVTNNRILSTDGLLRLRYNPSSLKSKHKEPYVFRSDIFYDSHIRLNDWEDYQRLVKEDEKLAFINKYIQIEKEDFDMAKINVGMDFYFAIDSKKYCKDVAKKAGIEPDFSILRTPEVSEAERIRHKTFLEVNSIHDVEV